MDLLNLLDDIDKSMKSNDLKKYEGMKVMEDEEGSEEIEEEEDESGDE